jgi:hypothetical protein
MTRIAGVTLMLLTACATLPAAPSSTHPPAPFPLGPRESRAVVFTRVPTPWWAPDFLVTRRFIDSLPTYAAMPKLAHKAYTLSEDRRFGGLYLWADRESAERAFDAAWHERVRKTRGVDGDVRILDAPWTVEGVPASGTALPHHALRADAAVVWVWAPAVDDATARLRALAEAHGLPGGVVRASLVTDASGGAGLVELWASADEARVFWTAARQRAAQDALGAEVSVTWFKAPVLLDAAAGQASAQVAR